MRLIVAACAALALMTGPAFANPAEGQAKSPVIAPGGEVLTPEKLDSFRTTGAAVLFWSQAERDANFRAMEAKFPGRIVRRGSHVHPLPRGRSLPISTADVDHHMAENNVAGLIVVQDGKVRLERYARGYSSRGRWTSFSVAKSFTSTLVGAAIKDGYIKSVNDPVTAYLPELAGSGYDGVTVAQLLSMTSGVKWNEDYFDPNSDVAKMYAQRVPPGIDPTLAYMRTLPRDTAPGSKWVYKTGETNLIGVLVAKATGKALADYLSEKVWLPFGMEQDAFWMVDPSRQEIGGCCLSVALRDYARMGLFVLGGGKGAVNPDWFPAATSAKVTIGPGYGYGYQWWTYPDGMFGAQGIFGQSIFIDPAHHIVIAMSSAWPRATDRKLSQARAAFQEKLEAAALGK
jgi:CubicO group peptidase (beta-lactamase class C family)